jgi:putative transposase
MTLPRKQLISIEDTPYYHIVSRCVRSAFLCGKDKYSSKSYEHRRGLIVDRAKFLASVFHVDICSYAIMSNHYHLVLKVNDTKDWSIHQVLMNWSSLCSLPYLCQKFLDKQDMEKAEMREVLSIVKEYRNRLMSISWFMKLLNQDIAFKANAEDGCKGHFFIIYILVNSASRRLSRSNLILSNLVNYDLKSKHFLMKEHCILISV